ncbi:hypothetical protein SAMN05660748_2053 [Blastococcus aggregatus]|uniref:Uncharacterized protein n=1 Tax=Blastococcus aggregatus TaxID=38502 RepID=A0A285V5C7_9ACTN|nr:hypothetical protein SAMN05660748_2053 [Blastococcus aggregatus]
MGHKLLIGLAVGLPAAWLLGIGLSLVLPWTTTDATGRETLDGPGAVLFYLTLLGGAALTLVAVVACIAWGLIVLVGRGRKRSGAR